MGSEIEQRSRNGGENMAAEKLTAAIEARGIKQKFLADKLGISESTLSAMLNGRQKIDVDTFFGICSLLQMTPDEIYAFKREDL